jgi:hypothetical protein
MPIEIDIEKLAREAEIVTEGLSFATDQIDDLSRFAGLVLEAAALECEDNMHPEDGPYAYAYAIRAMKPGVKP